MLTLDQARTASFPLLVCEVAQRDDGAGLEAVYHAFAKHISCYMARKDFFVLMLLIGEVRPAGLMWERALGNLRVISALHRMGRVSRWLERSFDLPECPEDWQVLAACMLLACQEICPLPIADQDMLLQEKLFARLCHYS